MLNSLLSTLRAKNPSAEVQLIQRRVGIVIHTQVPPEQLKLPEGWVLKGPDVGYRYLVGCDLEGQRQEYPVTDSEQRVLP